MLTTAFLWYKGYANVWLIMPPIAIAVAKDSFQTYQFQRIFSVNTPKLLDLFTTIFQLQLKQSQSNN